MPDKDSDHEYVEAEDEDYNPNAPGSAASSSSDDEAEPAKQQQRKRKDHEHEELDSGDEATIRERQSHKRRKTEDDQAEDSGSFIRTRAQREAEKVEAKTRKRGAIAGRVTVDVDTLWAELNNLPIGQASTQTYLKSDEYDPDTNDGTDQPHRSETITIKRRIKFAGAITEVEEEVARDSREAQAWLAEQAEEKEQQQLEKGSGQTEDIQRPLRRISKFEPNPLGIVKGVPADKLRRKAPSRIDLVMAERRLEEERAKKAEKLNTMQKTQLDWKGFVVEQGLGEELKEYGKSKKGFAAREAFLDQVHYAKESARRTARLKG